MAYLSVCFFSPLLIKPRRKLNHIQTSQRRVAQNPYKQRWDVGEEFTTQGIKDEELGKEGSEGRRTVKSVFVSPLNGNVV